jgi:hypothetical protein
MLSLQGTLIARIIIIKPGMYKKMKAALVRAAFISMNRN